MSAGGAFPEEKFEYSEEINGRDATINVEFSNINATTLPGVAIQEADGELAYEDTTFYNASASTAPSDAEMGSEMMSGFVLEYTLEMPGEITNSTADKVDGNTATWTRTGGDAYDNTQIEATSEISSSVLSTGFGAVPAVAALLVIGGLYRRSSR